MLKKIIKNKYIKYLISIIFLTMTIVLIHDFFVKRNCTSHVVQNHYFYSGTGSEGGSSYYKYPYIYKGKHLEKFPQPYSNKNKNGYKRFNTLNDAEKYCFIEKSIF